MNRASRPPLEVTFLGTSAASGVARENTSATLLRYGEQLILVDCGVNALAQLRRCGVEASDLTAVVLTHWHTDHVAGLPQLIAASSVVGANGTKSPLRVWAPPPPRILAPALALPPRKVDLRQAGDGTVVQIDGAVLRATGTDHTIVSVAWTFEEAGPAGRKVLFTGDARPSFPLIRAAKKADLLIHDSTYSHAHAGWAKRLGHSTARQAAVDARSARAGTLVLTHISSREKREKLRAEASRRFRNTIVAEDLDTVSVSPQRHIYFRRGPAARHVVGLVSHTSSLNL